MTAGAVTPTRTGAVVRYPRLAAGLDHGRLWLKNRIVFPRHQTLM